MEGKKIQGSGEGFGPLTVFASLLSGFLLLGTGFLAGWYWQNARIQDVVRVEIVENPPAPVIASVSTEGEEALLKQEELLQGSEECQFVGSKNSDKYHSPDSAPAKRILSENVICFASEEEAIEAGYDEGTVN